MPREIRKNSYKPSKPSIPSKLCPKNSNRFKGEIRGEPIPTRFIFPIPLTSNTERGRCQAVNDFCSFRIIVAYSAIVVATKAGSKLVSLFEKRGAAFKESRASDTFMRKHVSNRFDECRLPCLISRQRLLFFSAVFVFCQ